MNRDIRWKQRFANFQKALRQLKEFLEQPVLNKLEKQGLIQCFEYTFELAWKTAKDYLEEQGFDIISPRQTIQTAYQSQLISNGHLGSTPWKNGILWRIPMMKKKRMRLKS